MTETKFGFLCNNDTIQLISRDDTDKVQVRWETLYGLGFDPRPVKITIHDYLEEEQP